MLKDITGREFDDEPTDFLRWFTRHHGEITVPANDAMSFVGGHAGLVIFRRGQFQVQLFTGGPNLNIPDHTHPNVDSYEVFLYGMLFTLEGKSIAPNEKEMLRGTRVLPWDTSAPLHAYKCIRVLPNNKHGGVVSSKGGAFLSVQQWLNGVKPTCVTTDWDGEHIDAGHKARQHAVAGR
jgi:hypothetical protein